MLDTNPDARLAHSVRTTIESDGDALADFHLWRLGPGHLGAILSTATRSGRSIEFYRTKLTRFRSLSHLTMEVHTA